jgi:hypothetical protein
MPLPSVEVAPGEIELREDALAVEEAVEVAIGVREAAHDKSLGVDAECGKTHCAWRIKLSKSAAQQREGMR